MHFSPACARAAACPPSLVGSLKHTRPDALSSRRRFVQSKPSCHIPLARSTCRNRQARSRVASAAGPPGELGPAQAGSSDAAAPGSPPSAWDVRTWEWKNGWKINYASAGKGSPIILVHGFGASLGQFRRNIPALAAAGYQVYAVDLLGFGASSKPIDLQFSMQVWCDQLVDFVKDVVQPECEGSEGVVFVGNSIGSLSSLMANAALPDDAVRGMVLLNCAAGMNNKAVSDDWRIKLAMPIFYLIDFILKSRIGSWLFEKIRQKENIRSALGNIYSSTESVDDELVDLFYNPSCDEGASEVFISVYTGQEAGPTPMEVMPSVRGPVLVLWGEEDLLTPLDGPGGRFFRGLSLVRPDTKFETLPNSGHCPHDDRPSLVNEKVLAWVGALK